MAVNFFTQDCEYNLKNKTKIRSVIAQCVADEGFRLGEVSVVLCSDAYLLEMNRQYLGHDYLTDVITFDYTDYDARIVGGDVFVSVDTVADNAVRFGETAHHEMVRVVFHGILHLCGQGDKTPEEEKMMHAKEDKYLKIYNEVRV